VVITISSKVSLESADCVLDTYFLPDRFFELTTGFLSVSAKAIGVATISKPIKATLELSGKGGVLLIII